MSDRSRHSLNLTEIIDSASMIELLRQELEKEGFITEGSRCERQSEDGIKVTVDLEAREVEISLERDVLITAEVEVSQSYDADFQKKATIEERLKARLELETNEKLNALSRPHQESLTAELEASLEEHRRALNLPLQRMYAEALRIKAGQLGEIVEIRDSTVDGHYDLFIKIKQ